ncbi:MAG TPA: Rho termination factor N-terminal domain-containing protein [Anaerolineales bacterium]|nr:Rho termination factor N-terminal domain-containing protein [Bryobacterales bacterium]HMM98569.1 Rho termination factor N-terminal domain-containing protein [Anaerolineales bacterium]
MITVKMLRDEPVVLPTGAVWLKKDHEYDLDESNANSLLGRGYAVLVAKNGKGERLERAVLEKMTVVELRKLAEEHGVPDVSLLKKGNLLDALCPLPEPSVDDVKETNEVAA